MTSDDLQTLIAAGLNCEHLVVEGDGRHFEAVIVSKAFAGKGVLQQHQVVYRALADKMDEIHALSMKTFTPEQWANRT